MVSVKSPFLSLSFIWLVASSRWAIIGTRFFSCAVFICLLMNTTIELYNPYPHQLAVHDAITKHLDEHPAGDSLRQHIFAVNAMRQVGKTTLVGNELLRFGFEIPNGESIYISPTFELAKKMLSDFSKAIGGTALCNSINKTDRQVLLSDGHLLRFLSAEQGDSIRGLNVSGVLVLDEFAYMRREFVEEVVAPFTDFHKAPTITISTPRTKRGLHYEYQCLGKIAGSGITSIDWANFDLSYLHSPEFMAQKQSILPERTFKTDYLGLFLDSESAVFGDLKPVLLPKGVRPPALRLYWGIDWATGASKDRTVLTAFNELDQQVFVREWSTEPPMQQVREIADIIMANKAKTDRVTAEKNSMGAVYIDALRARLEDIPIIEFTTTNESKRRIVDNMVVAIEQKTTRLLNNETQTAEFEYFEANTLKSGVVQYAAPASLHDDYVMAVCLARSGRDVVNAWG